MSGVDRSRKRNLFSGGENWSLLSSPFFLGNVSTLRVESSWGKGGSEI